MSAEERFLEAIAEEDGELEVNSLSDRFTLKHARLQRKNQNTIDDFLGKGQRTDAITMMPRYYGELLTWALYRYIQKEGWRAAFTLKYHGPEPVYIDVSTELGKSENLLMDGQLCVEKGDLRFVVTVDVNMRWRNSIRVEGLATKNQDIKKFASGINSIAGKENYYRGKKLEFAGRIRFLDFSTFSWDNIILDADVKLELRANTVEFLKGRELWAKYGIPTKRGILLAGDPGTGKTVICKALLADAEGITCIVTNAYALDGEEYITELYEMAQDLSPSIVFIEDIDLIGQNREEFGYRRGPALLSLLTVLDGIEEKKEIVTVATSNSLDVLDKALSERPSRFDRVVKISRPTCEQRREQISRLCQKIPLNETTQEYIGFKTEGCTPAQVQEIVYSLAIEYFKGISEPSDINLSKNDIDRIISKINCGNNRRIGFFNENNHNGTGFPKTERLELI